MKLQTHRDPEFDREERTTAEFQLPRIWRAHEEIGITGTLVMVYFNKIDCLKPFLPFGI